MNGERSVLTLGESMGLMRGDGVGGFEQLAAARIDTGGAEGNTAVGLARLGVPVTWLGRVGDDALGRRVAGDLRSEGVDVIAVVDAAAPTGLMLKSTPRAGTTVVDYYRSGSAGSRLSPSDLDRVDIPSYRVLHVTGVTLALSASARSTVLDAVTRAKAAGLLVSFAVNHRAKLWSHVHAAAVYAELLASADIVFASDDEARLLAPDADPDDPGGLARAIATRGPAEVLVTLGEQGCVALLAGESHRAPAERIVPVDTVGAGDAFAAGYLAERVREAPPAERLRVATRCGAWACLHPGDWQGAPRRAELSSGTRDAVIR
ncbi:sugar kinase [Microbacterium sp. SORGH_AS_0888]|uniref:sugar kinase n=1 Tax=Microbacterium sp. SORGH_AS_0888 TaxID=3041791 RepID=UPI00278B1E50|nr:sugar kinase [Microbacterium sp. SORGH_AS_0888]MDQ1130297.1 2-dehydro-3-deoxygluconokinase [Microbacterium sp. SORGH_AS_0888]